MYLFFLLEILTIVINKPLKPSIGGDKNKDKDNPFAGMSDADLDKMMKDYGLESKDLGINKKDNGKNSKSKKSLSPFDSLSLEDDPLAMLSGHKKENNDEVPMKINEIYNKNRQILKNFELSSLDAHTLVNLVSKYQIFDRLPVTAMNIINEVHQSPSYDKLDKLDNSGSKQDETNILISNTLNSQVFIDQENKVGRKGMLTLVNKDTAEIRNVWAVLNSKVFCLYKSSNYLKILKIYRVSMLKIKDYIFSPCFFVYYENDNQQQKFRSNKKKGEIRGLKNLQDKEKKVNLSLSSFKETQSLICALNFREKDYWLKLINYHKEQYKN
jgi:hypothetical protein